MKLWYSPRYFCNVFPIMSKSGHAYHALLGIVPATMLCQIVRSRIKNFLSALLNIAGVYLSLWSESREFLKGLNNNIGRLLGGMSPCLYFL